MTPAEEFDAWYALYPRKVAKGAARKAFSKARKIASQDVLCAAAAKFAEKLKGQDKQFIPYPATWLNREQWLDDEPKTSIERLIKDTERVYSRVKMALKFREIMVDRQEVMLALRAEKITPEEAKRLGL